MNSTDASCINPVGLEYYENRLITFDTYPKQLLPNKYQLARAGFYYTGKADIVICFRCHVQVSSWERHDDACEEHLRWSSNCEYLRMVGYEKHTPPTSTEFRAFVNTPQSPPTMDKTLFKFGSNSTTGANLFVKRLTNL